MIRFVLILLCAHFWACRASGFAQKSGTPPCTAGARHLSTEQAHAALEVLNDPAKRAAFAATLNAIIKAQPGTAAAEPAEAAKHPPTETTVEGLKIPLAPDSLGAQVLLSASQFVSRLGTRAMDALNTVQSLPLLYGWVVVMATNYTARSLLEDVVWRVALVLACAVAVEYGLRRAMRRPIRSLERLAPRSSQDRLGDTSPGHRSRGRIADDARAEADDDDARAEADDDAPPQPTPSLVPRPVRSRRRSRIATAPRPGPCSNASRWLLPACCWNWCPSLASS